MMETKIQIDLNYGTNLGAIKALVILILFSKAQTERSNHRKQEAI
jgi:hypothetical protein